MSRSAYIDDFDEDAWSFIRWRGAVASSIRGQRGQRLLRELADAMDAMPVRGLIAGRLEADGAYCALGVVGAARGLDLKGVDPEDSEAVSKLLDIAEPLAREIVFINDDDFGYGAETAAKRWTRVRKWVGEQLRRKRGGSGTNDWDQFTVRLNNDHPAVRVAKTNDLAVVFLAAALVAENAVGPQTSFPGMRDAGDPTVSGVLGKLLADIEASSVGSSSLERSGTEGR